METIFPYDLLHLGNFSRNATDSDKVNNGCSPSVFRWLACWLVYVFSRFYLFFSEFTFVTQNKGPLLKTSQNCSESLMVLNFTAAANKCTICMAKAMLSQFSFLFWNVLMLVTYWMEASLVSESLMSIGRVYQREFKKSLQLHTTLRICRSEVTVLYSSRFSKTMNCIHKSFNFFSLFLIMFSLFIDNTISIWVPFTEQLESGSINSGQQAQWVNWSAHLKIQDDNDKALIILRCQNKVCVFSYHY